MHYYNLYRIKILKQTINKLINQYSVNYNIENLFHFYN